MIDSVFAHVDAARAAQPWRELGLEAGGYALVTLHRPSLVDDDDRLAATVDGLIALRQSLPVVFPVHPRTRARLERLGLDRRLAASGVTATSPTRLPRLPRPRGRGASRADRLGRCPGGDLGARACRASRCATAPSGRSPSSSARTRSSAPGPSGSRRSRRLLGAAAPAEPIPLWDGRAGARAAEVLLGYLGSHA